MKLINICLIISSLTFATQAKGFASPSPVGEGRGEAPDSIDIGADITIPYYESTAAVSIIRHKDINKTSSKDIGNDIIGEGLGLVSKPAANNYASADPSFVVRGLQTLNSNNSPLILVDGLERSIKNVSAEEVEEVQILKDAAATALYGYRGTNGAILIKTKRGVYNSKHISFSYDHDINFLSGKPKFVDAYTYASAMNEARANDGLAARYTDAELQAFKNGTDPYNYPNVDWVDETFRNQGVTNHYNVEFQGGAKKFRYYALLGLISDKGFIRNYDLNDGYSTQNKYVRGNLRVNLDAELTKTTKMSFNLMGVLLESNRPGNSTNIWSLVYGLPSAAIPVKTEDGLWGGNSTWDGTENPVAQSAGAAYSKNHTRSLYADITIKQDLSAILKGLGATARIGYDNTSNIYENHSKTYVYGMGDYTGGRDTEMGDGASTNDYEHLFHFNVGLDYNGRFGESSLFTQLRWDYENQETYGVSTVLYRQNFSSWTHYGYKDRYFADLALVVSGSNCLAPGHKWAFSPTLSAAWVISKERFLENAKWLNLLKVRASAGILNADYLPFGIWNYYQQTYGINGSSYLFTNGFSSAGITGTTLGRIASENTTHEKAYKYNIGLDARLFDCLGITFDAFYQRRTDIWVSSSGKYTNLIGYNKPYENAGRVDSWGYELGLDFSKKFGEVTVNAAANVSLNRSEIKDELEEPRLYDNLKETGHRVDQIFGLKAIGFFKDEADIANSPKQTFSDVKPGDIKYADINGDNIIDSNDKIALGYNNTCPELYYNFHLGAEWKGIGVDAMFRGAGRYSAILNTKSLFWPLIKNTTISQYYYDNRWTEATASTALFPRLSSESNDNNYQTNSLWVKDRNFFKLRYVELYYNFPTSLLSKTGFLNAAKLYVRGTNLFSVDDFDVADPENYGANSPVVKSLVLGLKVTL